MTNSPIALSTPMKSMRKLYTALTASKLAFYDWFRASRRSRMVLMPWFCSVLADNKSKTVIIIDMYCLRQGCSCSNVALMFIAEKDESCLVTYHLLTLRRTPIIVVVEITLLNILLASFYFDCPWQSFPLTINNYPSLLIAKKGVST